MTARGEEVDDADDVRDVGGVEREAFYVCIMSNPRRERKAEQQNTDGRRGRK